MKSTGSSFTTLLLVICLVAAAWEGVELSRVSRENAELRAKAAGEKSQVDAKVAKEMMKHGTELRVLRVQNQDLLKLRTEVRRLRPLTNEVALLHAQVRALGGGGTNQPVVTKAAGLETAADTFFPRADWSFAGYSNPEAAIQSVIWAGSQGDLDVFLASLTPDGRAKFEEQAQRQNKSEEDMITGLKQGFIQLTGFSILDQNVLPDDSVMMRVEMAGQNQVQRFFFKRIGEEWRLSDSKNDK